jgi:hypothetical protein
MMPYIDQAPLFNQISGNWNGYAPFSAVPWDGNYGPFITNIPVIMCPSDSMTSAGWIIGKTNYMFCRGDSPWDHNEWTSNGGRGFRGMFSGNAWCQGLRDCTDGLSNTIAMSERIQAKNDNDGMVSHGDTVINVGGTFVHNNPSLCLAQISGIMYTNAGNARAWGGTRWPDGAPSFTGCTTVLGPNKGSCTQGGWDGEDGIYEPSSQHVGGVHCLMGDGAVRFVSNNINTGNTTCPPPDGSAGGSAPCGGVWGGPSPYGVWGALGSKGGGDMVGNF